ncbi:MAG: hydantoinase/oxoprolinase family protein [Planctomycetia bacterium]|nr:hydantoinase/oxoprolinase family protein [Planctomycetia bacterium]
MTVLGIDVGGAALKASDGAQYSRSMPFELWKRPQDLTAALTELTAAAPAVGRVFATMTGELADCFSTKAEGVAHICAALEQAFPEPTLQIYRTDGTIVSTEEACDKPLAAAASNWHVLARFAGRYAAQGAGLLIDIGSTTTDVVPLRDGIPCPSGWTDSERMMCGELVYTGVERSPVCAIAGAVPYRGGQCPTAQEFFATAGDAYRILGDLPEDSECIATADGRPATKTFARDRLARSICSDRTLFDDDDALAAAKAIAIAQQAKIGVALHGLIRRLGSPPKAIVISGQGEFLARAVVQKLRSDASVVSLHEQLGPAASRVAPAFALAILARELNW